MLFEEPFYAYFIDFIKGSLMYSKSILIPKTIAFSQLYDVINALYGAYQIPYTYYCSSKNRTVALEKPRNETC